VPPRYTLVTDGSMETLVKPMFPIAEAEENGWVVQANAPPMKLRTSKPAPLAAAGMVDVVPPLELMMLVVAEAV